LHELHVREAQHAWTRPEAVPGSLRCLPRLSRRAARREQRACDSRAAAAARYVPAALAERQPGARIEPAGNWGGFTERFCCVRLLNPLDPLFTEIGSAFVKARAPAERGSPGCLQRCRPGCRLKQRVQKCIGVRSSQLVRRHWGEGHQG